MSVKLQAEAVIPRLLVVIIDRDRHEKLEEIMREKHVLFPYLFNGRGTASSDLLKTFGLSGTDKTVCVCAEPITRMGSLLMSVAERLELTRPGNGIAFTIPITSVSASISRAFAKRDMLEQIFERNEENMDRETGEKEAMYELVVAVINKGYTDVLMDAAHEAGARGGTIVSARRTGMADAVKFFGVSLFAEKEIVAILTQRENKKELMQEISKHCGMRTEAHGIIFSLPVESCAGLPEPLPTGEKEDAKKED